MNKMNKMNKMKDKKGLVLNFLVTIILALILFIPVIMGISKFLRLSEQAEDSFEIFSTAIKTVAETGQSKVEFLHLDADTMVVGFNAGQNTHICTADNVCGNILYPQECHGESCLCLCQVYEGDASIIVAGQNQESIICKQRASCSTLGPTVFKSPLSTSYFYVADPGYHASTGHFENGFVIARGRVQFSAYPFDFKNLRRVAFEIIPQEGAIIVCREGTCDSI